MKRRKLLLGIAAIPAVGALAWRGTAPEAELLTTESCLARLRAMQGKTVTSSGEWSAAKVFEHCAQSVEYSLAGYPQLNSDTFRSTVGLLAYSMFSLGRRMQHPLDEAIPGAEPLVMDDTQKALARLIKSLEVFAAHDGALKPHFAFGQLDKGEYARVHAMHLNQHLQELHL